MLPAELQCTWSRRFRKGSTNPTTKTRHSTCDENMREHHHVSESCYDLFLVFHGSLVDIYIYIRYCLKATQGLVEKHSSMRYTLLPSSLFKKHAVGLRHTVLSCSFLVCSMACHRRSKHGWCVRRQNVRDNECKRRDPTTDWKCKLVHFQPHTG